MDKITKVRINNGDGTYTPAVPLGADAQNIVLSTGYTVEQAIADLDVGADGNIKKQLDTIKRQIQKIKNRLAALQQA